MPSRRYQSQLFRFVTQQTQKIADKTATLGRHAKVAAIWTTQILLYPVYAVFQTTRLAGRQLGATVQKAVLKVQAQGSVNEASIDELLAIDAPIVHVLSSIKQALSTGEIPKPERNPLVLIVRWFQQLKPQPATELESQSITHQSFDRSEAPNLTRSRLESLTPNRYRIQGVASLTDTRHLVLILEGNVILDILTLEQQRQLDRRMIWELAMYWRRRRRLRLKQAPLSLPDDRPTLLPPVRVFRQLMAWIQTSPIAIAANLFQETELDAPTEIDWFNPSVPLSAFNPGNLMPREMPKSDNLGAWFAGLPKWAELEAIVWAAIHYFFGNERNRFSPASAQLPASETLLSFTEVYGESLPTVQPQFRTKAVQLAAQPPTRSRQSFALPIRSLRRWIEDALNRVSEAIVVFNQTRKAVSTETDSDAIRTNQKIVRQRSTSVATQFASSTRAKSSISAERTFAEIAQPPRSSISRSTVESNLTPSAKRSTLEHNPDWIETSVQHVEYVRSPLQRVLSWIDSGISWIERKLVALWRRITR